MNILEQINRFIKGLELKKQRMENSENWKAVTGVLNIGILKTEDLTKAVELFEKISNNFIMWITAYYPIIRTYQSMVEGYEISADVLQGQIVKAHEDSYKKQYLEQRLTEDIYDAKKTKQITADALELVLTMEQNIEKLFSEIVNSARYLEEIDKENWKELIDQLLIIRCNVIAVSLANQGLSKNETKDFSKNIESDEVKLKLEFASRILEEIKNGEIQGIAMFEDYLVKKASEINV